MATHTAETPSHELRDRIQSFRDDYLNTPAGQKHLATIEAEPREVQTIFEDIRAKHAAGTDITDDVLRRLLPHTDSQYHRENGYRVSTWPCITKDVRAWFEGAGWKTSEDWPEVTRLLFEALDGLVHGDSSAWEAFLHSKYRLGFAAGFVSPILFCLDSTYPVINSKVVKTYAYCTAQLGEPDQIDARLEAYLQNAEKVKTLQKRLEPYGLNTIQEWDMFCHFMVSKRLGGGDLTVVVEPTYRAWLFVANPEIYRWEQAFEEGTVDWTGSLGSYAQKLLRTQIHVGDRAFGYQAGPDFVLCCELKVATQPYKTADGTWATRLTPLRRLPSDLPLSLLKQHPILSSLKFLQQSQLSISGITQEQLDALDALVAHPQPLAEKRPLVQLCLDLSEAQHDTEHPDRFEELLANAFDFLGFEVEHLGGPGRTDVLVVGRLGPDTYKAVVDAKTCKSRCSIGGLTYDSINDHRAEQGADYALVIAPGFSGGKQIEHAVKANVGLVTTDALIAVLKLHDPFPFSLVELERFLQVKGRAQGIESELGRVHKWHTSLLEIAGTVLHAFEDLQRQEDNADPLSGTAIRYWLKGRALHETDAPPDSAEIEQALSLLSSPILDILTKQESGYVLTLSPNAAIARIEALAAALESED